MHWKVANFRSVTRDSLSSSIAPMPAMLIVHTPTCAAPTGRGNHENAWKNDDFWRKTIEKPSMSIDLDGTSALDKAISSCPGRHGGVQHGAAEAAHSATAHEQAEAFC